MRYLITVFGGSTLFSGRASYAYKCANKLTP